MADISLNRAQYIWQQYLRNEVTAAEYQELRDLLESNPALMAALIGIELDMVDKDPKTITKFLPNEKAVTILTSILANTSTPKIKKIATIWRYAIAAILILAIGSGVYYFNSPSYKSQKSSQITLQTKAPNDVQPGTNKAIWTLADGEQLELDSSILDMTHKRLDDAGHNKLSTPRGGQYQLILPDGSKVWLNAASSIKYPVIFDANERRIEVTGEAYFEIVKDASKPFKVSGGGQEIEVLGTSFNINIYDDEPTKKTTLIAGSIKITHNNQTAILQPGQQANIPILEIPKIRLIPVQTSDIIAWKNQLFRFNDLPLEDIMRQLARWYNLEVEYKTKINRKFLATMSRNEPVSKILHMLELTGDVHFSIEGNKVIVMP